MLDSSTYKKHCKTIENENKISVHPRFLGKGDMPQNCYFTAGGKGSFNTQNRITFYGSSHAAFVWHGPTPFAIVCDCVRKAHAAYDIEVKPKTAGCANTSKVYCGEDETEWRTESICPMWRPRDCREAWCALQARFLGLDAINKYHFFHFIMNSFHACCNVIWCRGICLSSLEVTGISKSMPTEKVMFQAES